MCMLCSYEIICQDSEFRQMLKVNQTLQGDEPNTSVSLMKLVKWLNKTSFKTETTLRRGLIVWLSEDKWLICPQEPEVLANSG